jgi:hypothetical protein
MCAVERLDVVPVDEEGASLLSEFLHVEQEVERDHRVAVVVIVAEAGTAFVLLSVPGKTEDRRGANMMATRWVRCAR